MSKNMLFLAWFVAGICPAVLAAQSYKSLNDKVQLQMEHTTAAAVVKALQQQTKYTFIYDPEYLQLCKVSAPHFNSHSIADVLRYLDENEPIDIEMTNGSTIALRRGRQERVAAKDGKITGKIVDNKNEPLPGVTILVDGGRGAISQADGTYELNLPPGNYTITYSFISYETKRVTDVVVREDANTPLNVLLRNSGSRLKEVTVTASYRKASVEGLYAMQKNNAAMTDGISAEQIARTPDKNLGETLKRVNGVATVENKYVVVRGLSERYNQAVLNGQIMPSTELNRKNFSFNIIPTSMVENVQVVKTLTPDHSAEFGGGSVEVTTLDIPASNFLVLNAGVSYNDNTTGKTFLSLPLDGQEYRGLPSKSRYLYGSLNWKGRTDIYRYYDEHKNTASQLPNNWGITAFNAAPSQNYQVSAGHVFRKGSQQLGIVASLGYRNTQATQDVILGRGYFENSVFDGKRYNFTTDLGAMLGMGWRYAGSKISMQSLYLRQLDQPLIVGTGMANDIGKALGIYDLTTSYNLLQAQLKGEHKLGGKGIKLNWMTSYLRMDKQRPDNHQLTSLYLQPDSTVENGFNISDDNLHGEGTTFGALRSWSRALEKNFSWSVNVSAPFNINLGHTVLSNTAKAGYDGWYKDRMFYVTPGGQLFSSKGYFIPLQTAFTPEYGASYQFERIYNDDFHKKASLHAAYVMLDDKLGEKWRLVWGVRGEYYNLNSQNAQLDSVVATYAKNANLPEGTTPDVSALRKLEPNFRLFPSANLTYSLTAKMNLRLAYSKSIIRPDLRELAAFKEYDFELGGSYIGGFVRSTVIHHFDFRYEWYPGPGEVLSATLFYKKLDYPMEVYQKGANRDYELRNNKDARNTGIELEARKSFAFTGVPVIKNITLYGNFTYLDSRVRRLESFALASSEDNPDKAVVKEVIGPEEKRPQAGASNYIANAGAYYDSRYFNVGLSYNYVSNRAFRANEIYQLSLYERPLEALDLQCSVFFLKHHLEWKLTVANLLRSYNVVYKNRFDDNDPAWLGKRDPSTKELLYQSGKDYINYKATPGITYGTSVSYRF